MHNSLLGYAKNGIAEVIADGLRDDINNWAIDAYRTLKFYSPATGELKTWLEANAVKMPLEGTWVFNESITAPVAFSGPRNLIDCETSFNSNGNVYTLMEVYDESGDGITPTLIYFNTDDNDEVEVYNENGESSGWTNQAYRTITFTEPVKSEGNEEFVRWFVDNAVPLEG